MPLCIITIILLLILWNETCLLSIQISLLSTDCQWLSTFLLDAEIWVPPQMLCLRWSFLRSVAHSLVCLVLFPDITSKIWGVQFQFFHVRCFHYVFFCQLKLDGGCPGWNFQGPSVKKIIQRSQNFFHILPIEYCYECGYCCVCNFLGL